MTVTGSPVSAGCGRAGTQAFAEQRWVGGHAVSRVQTTRAQTASVQTLWPGQSKSSSHSPQPNDSSAHVRPKRSNRMA